MIALYFVFLGKISSKREKLFWQQGVLDWNNFLKIERITSTQKGHDGNLVDLWKALKFKFNFPISTTPAHPPFSLDMHRLFSLLL